MLRKRGRAFRGAHRNSTDRVEIVRQNFGGELNSSAVESLNKGLYDASGDAGSLHLNNWGDS
eukprot:953134-Prorocentrum_minimum.AAC.2